MIPYDSDRDSNLDDEEYGFAGRIETMDVGMNTINYQENMAMESEIAGKYKN